MNKISNYQKMLKQLDQQDSNNKKKLLLHCCCAPCSGWVIQYLLSYFNLTIYFNNSNIYPQTEYNKRLSELKRFIKEANFHIQIIETAYNPQFMLDLFPLANEPEGGRRCYQCFERRMSQAFDYADEYNYDYFTSVMSISAHKNSEVLNQLGEELALAHHSKFLNNDFKKGNGIQESIIVIRQYNLYRQNYCGCVYSMKCNPDWTLDYLPSTKIFLYQHREMFRINTDTRLLGEYLNVMPGERVLDLGCNNGALLLYAAKNKPKCLVGVDINQQAIELATRNMEINQLDNYNFWVGNLNNYVTQEPFDVILCNPPYFSDNNLNNNKHFAVARHFIDITADQWVDKMSQLLDKNGRIYLVYRYDEFARFQALLSARTLFITHQQLVYEPRKKRYQSVLVTLEKQCKQTIKAEDHWIVADIADR